MSLGPASAVAALTAGLAVALAMSPPQQLIGADTRERARWRRRVLPAVLALALVVVLPTAWVAPCVISMAAAGAAGLLWHRRRERLAAHDVADRVLEACEVIAAELAAGQPAGAALAQAGAEWPMLLPAAEAFRVGSDVPSALRGLSGRRGAGDLRLLAAAWQVSHRTGQGLTAAVDRVARELVASRATRRVVDGELASARATARLVAGLPVVALAMGTGAGSDPWRFLLATPGGWACLGLGLALGYAGLWWIEAIARDVDRGS